MQTKVKKFTVKDMVLCALMAAITGVLSQIGIPVGEVPINLALFSVFLAGGLLNSYKGAVSMLVYLLLGMVGVPVFSAFRGGVGVLAGPTGGYIIGYVFTALIVGLMASKWGYGFWFLSAYMLIGLAICYLFGTVWFVILTGKGLIAALSVCVIPFLPGDAIKIICAGILIPRLRKAVYTGTR